jgi:hypothetical protein
VERKRNNISRVQYCGLYYNRLILLIFIFCLKKHQTVGIRLALGLGPSSANLSRTLSTAFVDKPLSSFLTMSKPHGAAENSGEHQAYDVLVIRETDRATPPFASAGGYCDG